MGVSEASFYRIRARAREQGPAAALRPASRAPKQPARRWGVEADERIAAIRAELIAQGREAGPWSVWWVMSQGATQPAPSRATIARRLRALGLVTPAPRKRPKTSYKRFTRSLANELWQIDGFCWPLEEGMVTVYQVIDDCSRLMVALHAAWGAEQADQVRSVLSQAFETWGAPAAVLSDNGTALNTHRTLGVPGVTETWLASQGIRPISGRVGHPQTQGKVERAHKGVQDWLAAHPVATLEELNAELDRYAAFYNNERQHQALGLAITPIKVWTATPRALPSPTPIDLQALPDTAPRNLPPITPQDPLRLTRRVLTNGTVSYKGRSIAVGKAMTGHQVLFLQYPTRLDLYDDQGAHFAAIAWPQPTQSQTGNRKAIDAIHPPNRLIPPPPRQPRSHKP